jgi:hypothetical protein
VSGIFRCISIISAAVILIQAVARTGAVDKYFNKFLSMFYFIKD